MVTQHSAIAYQSDNPTDYKWTRKAYELIVNGTSQAEIRQVDGIRVATFAGPCPCCFGTFNWRQELDAVVGTSGTLGEFESTGDPYVPLDIQCGCGIDHAGAESGVKNCGVVFRIEVKGPFDD